MSNSDVFEAMGLVKVLTWSEVRLTVDRTWARVALDDEARCYSCGDLVSSWNSGNTTGMWRRTDADGRVWHLDDFCFGGDEASVAKEFG